MPTPVDLLYVALFAICLPVWDHFVTWPELKRRLEAEPVEAKPKSWIKAIGYPWLLVMIGAVIWQQHDRSWGTLGFNVPEGWRLWFALAFVALLGLYMFSAISTVARNPEARASVRQQMNGPTADLMPRTVKELRLFGGVALTAGFCEEFLFRGYFIWALTPWVGVYGAATLSLIIFAFGHAYQGTSGIVNTAIAGLLFTMVFFVTGSLWPAMLLHFLWDLTMGIVAWQSLRT